MYGLENHAPKTKATVLVSCCGCGNVGLALANLDSAIRVICVDLSPEAVALAEENASDLGLRDRGGGDGVPL